MSILITGSNGFVGRHVVDYFLKNTSYQIHCLDIAASDMPKEDRIQFIEADLLSSEKIRDIIRDKRPRKIIHLAGLTSVSQSVKKPYDTFQTNVMSWLNLIEAVRLENLTPRILFISSGEVYGLPDHDNIMRLETHPVKPETPYAVSKAACELLARQYFITYGQKIIIARSFNHSGPGQSDSFVLSGFARRLMEVKLLNSEPVIYTGNIEVERDFLDVRDVAHAYSMLIENGKPGEAYNVCSGGALSLRWMLEELIRMSDVKVEVRMDMNLARKYDMPLLVGSNDKINVDIGWKPQIAFKDTLQSLLDYWSKRLVVKPA